MTRGEEGPRNDGGGEGGLRMMKGDGTPRNDNNGRPAAEGEPRNDERGRGDQRAGARGVTTAEGDHLIFLASRSSPPIPPG